MKVTSAEFIKSAFAEADWPRDVIPEIAFLGRSNVGKSSLINSLLGVKGLARTSSTPGRTQALNFFLINSLRACLRPSEIAGKNWQPTTLPSADSLCYQFTL